MNEEPASTLELYKRRDECLSGDILNDLRLNGQLCDVILKVQGAEFPVHKNVLCSCSPYFRDLFTSSWKNSRQQVYCMPEVHADIMGLILSYAYGGSISITLQNVWALLAAAYYFNVPGLVKLTCDYLQSEMTSRNCIGIRNLAEKFLCWRLWEQAQCFLLQHFQEVVQVSEEFVQMKRDELCQLIARDDLNVQKEAVVFEAILRWIAHDPDRRRSDISVLLSKVRMALMDADYFLHNVKNNEVVKRSRKCRSIVIEALRAMYHFRMNGPSLSIPMTCPRLPSAMLLALGGSTDDNSTVIEAYDIRVDNWVIVTVDRRNAWGVHGVAYLNGFVYCLGGFNGEAQFNCVHKMDLVRHTWHEVAPMYYGRCQVSVTVLDGSIYAMGGYDAQQRHNTAERYDPTTNQWNMIAPMRQPRCDASATTLHGKVYICGGSNGYECLSTAELYDPKTNQWSAIPRMRNRRSGLGLIAYKEQIFAVGGYNGIRQLKRCEAYNPSTNTWCQMPVMVTPRSHFGIEVVEDFLIAVGGYNGIKDICSVEYYDEATQEWHEAQDMTYCCSGLGCCVIPWRPKTHQPQ